MSDYEVTLEDFRQLLTYSPYRASTAMLLADCYGHAVSNEGNVSDAHGNPVDVRTLHAAIQADSHHQVTLYRTSVSLWR